MLTRALVLSVLASVVVAAPAGAAPGAVASFRPHPRDAAATVVVFRIDAALPARAEGWIDGRSVSLTTVSPRLHCYLAEVPA
jgi:hypothetical protein